MTTEFKQYVLKNVPTNVLLKEFRNVRWAHYLGRPTNIGYYHSGECSDWCDYRVRITVGKFAYWNPYKGHGCECIFTQDEVKNELNLRENI